MSTQPTLKDLHLQCQFVALEQVNENYSTSKSVSKFSSMVDTAKTFTANLLNPITAYFGSRGLNPHKEAETILAFTEKAKYPELKRYQVPCIEGFNGNLADYTKALVEANDKAVYIETNVVKPFNVFVGQLINNPALLNSLTHNHKINLVEIDKFKKELAKHYKPTGKNIVIDFHKAFGNMKQVKEYAENMKELVDYQQSAHVASLKESVKILNDNLGHLSDLMRSNQNNQLVNSRIMQTLSSLIYSVAEQVEFYAMINHMTSQNVEAAGRMADVMAQYQS